MTDIVAKLHTLEMKVDDSFIIRFILNSLPPQYGPFQTNYNSIKKKLECKWVDKHDSLIGSKTEITGHYSTNFVTKRVEKKSINMAKWKELDHRKERNIQRFIRFNIIVASATIVRNWDSWKLSI